MTSQIESLQSALTEAGFKASIWRESRIYLNGYDKDIKAYFDYPSNDPNADADDDPLFLSRLRVFSNCNQGRQRLINRCKQVKHSIMAKMVEGELMEEVCESWESVLL